VQKDASSGPVVGGSNVSAEEPQSQGVEQSSAASAIRSGSPAPLAPVVERVIVAPLQGRAVATEEYRREEPEEVVYGEIIRK